MKLLLDVGNTRVKWATVENGVFSHRGEFLHRSPSGYDLGVLRQQVVAKPSAVIVSNVAGADMAALLEDTVDEAWGIRIEFARTQRQAHGVTCGYRDVRQLGVDRWLAIVAAYVAQKGPVCVVDAGTALTADFVAADGQHLGGVIVPGSDLMQSALRADTGDIAVFASESSASARDGDELWFATSTADAIRNGARLAVGGLVGRAAQHLQQREPGATLVITGGDAPSLISTLTIPHHHRPTLVLDGLALCC